MILPGSTIHRGSFKNDRSDGNFRIQLHIFIVSTSMLCLTTIIFTDMSMTM